MIAVGGISQFLDSGVVTTGVSNDGGDNDINHNSGRPGGDVIAGSGGNTFSDPTSSGGTLFHAPITARDAGTPGAIAHSLVPKIVVVRDTGSGGGNGGGGGTGGTGGTDTTKTTDAATTKTPDDSSLINSLMGLVAAQYASAGASGGGSGTYGTVPATITPSTDTTQGKSPSAAIFLVLGVVAIVGWLIWRHVHKAKK